MVKHCGEMDTWSSIRSIFHPLVGWNNCLVDLLHHRFWNRCHDNDSGKEYRQTGRESLLWVQTKRKHSGDEAADLVS